MSVQFNLSTEIGEDRRLVIDLPGDIPAGPVEVVVRSLGDSTSPLLSNPNPEREAVRAKLAAAGFLSTTWDTLEGAQELTEAERLRLGTLPAWARPSEELIDEDRGPR